MNGILKKFIEVTDRIALVGVPDEKRKPEYRRRREKFAERDAVTEEETPELSGAATLEQAVENQVEPPAEKAVKSKRKNKFMDLLTAKLPKKDAATEEETPELKYAASAEETPELKDAATLEQAVEHQVETPAEKAVKSKKKNKFMDLLTAKPPEEETGVEIPVMPAPAATEIIPAPAQITPPASNTENSVASEKSGGKGEDKSSGLGNLMDLFKQIETEEESPLEHLIASLPDISATELLTDIKEVEGLIRAYVNIH